MRENRTSGSMRRDEKRVMVHSANGHRTRKGGNGGAPPDLHTTAPGFHSTPPIHASWLNQIEIYFSIVQRKVLTPNDFPSLVAVRARLLRFQYRYEHTAAPFQWTFTRRDLA